MVAKVQANGKDGLKSKSRRPHSSPNTKITYEIERLIIDLGKTVTLALGDYRVSYIGFTYGIFTLNTVMY